MSWYFGNGNVFCYGFSLYDFLIFLLWWFLDCRRKFVIKIVVDIFILLFLDFDVDKVFIRNWIENVKVYVEYKIFNVFKFILLRCFF